VRNSGIGLRFAISKGRGAMTKIPEVRRPFDPAKAMRDRNNAERAVALVTPQQRLAKRSYLRPEKRPLLREHD
jgi:hypothetical protein